VIIGHPIHQIRRHQHRLPTVTSNEVLRHPGMVLNRPDDPFTRQPRRRGGQGHLAARALLLSHRRRSGRQPWRLLDTAVSGSYEERPASASEPRREAWVSWSGSHVGPRS
jgi:hypothetical protein